MCRISSTPALLTVRPATGSGSAGNQADSWPWVEVTDLQWPLCSVCRVDVTGQGHWPQMTSVLRGLNLNLTLGGVYNRLLDWRGSCPVFKVRVEVHGLENIWWRWVEVRRWVLTSWWYFTTTRPSLVIISRSPITINHVGFTSVTSTNDEWLVPDEFVSGPGNQDFCVFSTIIGPVAPLRKK